MRIDRLFQILIVIFAAAGVYFWTEGNKDGIFASVVLASISFFLSVRFQAKDRMKQRESALAEDNQEI